MRVLHVDTEPGWRGGQRQVLLLALELRERGVDQLLAVQPGAPLLQEARRAGLTVTELRQSCELDLLAAWRLRRLALGWGASIVHAHAGHAHALAALAIPVRWRRGVRVVVSRRVDNPLRRGILSRWKWTRGADRILCVSEAVRRETLRMPGLDPHRVEVVYSAVPGRARGAVRAPGQGPVRLLSVGALVPHKGHEVLIRALPLLRAQAELCIYGEGPLRGRLEGLAAELGVAGRVRLPGFVPDVVERLGEQDLYVQPSVGEGLGTAILDAMLEGLPVVATDAGGISEIVIEGKTGWLAKAGDPQSLALAIDQACERVAEAYVMAERARDLVLARHGVQALGEATLSAYQRTLDELPSPFPGLSGKIKIGVQGPKVPGGSRAAPWWVEGEAPRVGRSQLIPVDWNGRRAWRKHHRRGGLLGAMRHGFWMPLGRIVASLQSEELARGLGLRVPETLEVEVVPAGKWRHEVWSVIEDLGGFVDLGELLKLSVVEPAFLRRVGQTLRRLHDGGGDHGDLNVKNVLHGPSGEVALVDWNPASVGPPLGLRKRRRRLGRLRRSLLKVAGNAEPWFTLVLEGYGLPGVWGRRQRLVAGLEHALHAMTWGKA